MRLDDQKECAQKKKDAPRTAPNSGSQVPLSLHPNFPTHSLRKTSGVPRPLAISPKH